MKEIIAIVRMNMINATKTALSDIGLPSFTARKVMGCGKGKVDYQLQDGGDDSQDEEVNSPKLMPKRMLTLVVPDGKVEEVVKTVIAANQTGSPGDGKIFVLPVEDAVRVRTGESGDQVLDL